MEGVIKPKHAKLDINRSIFSKEMRQWTDWHTYKKYKIVLNYCRNIQGISPENLKKIAHLQLEISKDNLISVRKWGNEQTDRHTINLKLSGTNVQTPQEYPENLRKIAPHELEISLIA